LIANSGDAAYCVSVNGQRSNDAETETLIAFSSKDYGGDAAADVSPTLRSGNHDGSHANIRAASGGSSRSYVAQPWAVRRLTPVECERLQGFPDGYTDIPWRGKDHSPDGPRYKALGNSMAVNVMQWIGERIAMVEALADEIDKADAA
jgi:DNA (cytosine-5)-methyltransferase 1